MRKAAIAALLLSSHPLHSEAAQIVACPGTGTVAGVVFTSSILNVDADGAPNSYRVDGNGLSYTCDGVLGIVNGKPVTPGRPNWQKVCQEAWSTAVKSGDYSNVDIFGFEKDEHGKPVVQGAGDPLPGEAYVSTTSMPVAGTPNKTQRHYVDATAIPYIVLTQDFAKAHHIAFGDVAVVYRPRNGRIAYGVFADTGPALGEASVKLHQDLGNEPIIVQSGVKRGKKGLDETTVTLMFPGHGTKASTNAVSWNKDIQTVGEAAFKGWGGLGRLQACVK